MATKKKKAEKRYIVRRRLASKKGDEVWERGAEIWLPDSVAALYITKHIVIPADETTPPPPPAEGLTVHTEGSDGNADSTESND